MDTVKIMLHDEIVFFTVTIYLDIAVILEEIKGSLLPFFTALAKTSSSSFLLMAKEYKRVMTDIAIPDTVM